LPPNLFSSFSSLLVLFHCSKFVNVFLRHGVCLAGE
jgi:hypothetical protein